MGLEFPLANYALRHSSLAQSPFADPGHSLQSDLFVWPPGANESSNKASLPPMLKQVPKEN